MSSEKGQTSDVARALSQPFLNPCLGRKLCQVVSSVVVVSCVEVISWCRVISYVNFASCVCENSKIQLSEIEPKKIIRSGKVNSDLGRSTQFGTSTQIWDGQLISGTVNGQLRFETVNRDLESQQLLGSGEPAVNQI
ncbi:hypothetical protein F511_07224 [Dorcoceras hygrometricum]|uniref:Uncharacterized protein n=1 Tax=Dorcoceras hygrometricum TaxID=472368 RepID=A0A2Z7AUG3_9LAMI|nr:hypothetical protein F511_07224 [Dorcoceras hygrometricum]